MSEGAAQRSEHRGLLRPVLGARRGLIAVATPMEARAVCRGLGADARLADLEWAIADATPAFDLLVTGVGKANAAGAVARALDPARHALALSVGIGGSLPARGEAPAPPIGALVLASASVFGDEGLLAPEGFTDVAAMGFPPAPGVGAAIPGDGRALGALRALADALGPIATVSTCSGVDALSAAVRARTGAIAEAMEGAAVALAAHRLGVSFVEARAISNTTGDRAAQRWDAARALARLESFIAAL